MVFRTSTYSDAEKIIALDQTAQKQRRRANFIHRSVASRQCFVAVVDDGVVGYGVLEHSFFENGLVSMLFVDPQFRRRGIGSGLLRYMERECKTEKLFTLSTESDLTMRGLLEKLGYQRSGLIENLSDGQPNLIYLRRLKGGRSV